jgi:hypothetical protein
VEGCAVRVDGRRRQIRFRDYDGLYSSPSLYEKVVYDIPGRGLPYVVRGPLEAELADAGRPGDELRILGFGAGNDMVGEELADAGAKFISNGDRSGFAGLLRAILDDGTLELRQRRRYQQRLATDRHPLDRVAIVGIKRRAVREHGLC